MAISFKDEDYPWFVDTKNFTATRQPLEGIKFHVKKRLFREATKYVWDDLILFCIGVDNLLRRCVTKGEQTTPYFGITTTHHIEATSTEKKQL